MISRMGLRKLAWIVENLTYRVRDFPDGAVNDLFRAIDTIERTYDLLEPLTDKERMAIEQAHAHIEAGRFVNHEELKAEWEHILKDYDWEAAGKEALLDVASRVKKLPGEEQVSIASVIFALLNETRFDR
jgi:hypothetical protein